MRMSVGSAFVAAALLVALGGSWVWAEEGSDSKEPVGPVSEMRDGPQKRLADSKYDGIHGRPGNGPKVGEVAPDFELMPLKFYEFKIDEADITKENAGELYRPVRLSDFRGKRPVVLIFGSYT